MHWFLACVGGGVGGSSTFEYMPSRILRIYVCEQEVDEYLQLDELSTHWIACRAGGLYFV